MKKKIITIAGDIGSGKSSAAKATAHILGYTHFSSGDFLRKIAEERGLSIEEMMVSAEEQKDIDHQVDALLRKMAQEQELFVIDSRLAWHWMPQSFKVFLSLDSDTAAQRIYDHIKREGRVSQTAESVKEMRDKIDIRLGTDIKRYRDLYNLDYTDRTHYDLVIDTKINNLDAVVSTILEGYKKWQEV